VPKEPATNDWETVWCGIGSSSRFVQSPRATTRIYCGLDLREDVGTTFRFEFGDGRFNQFMATIRGHPPINHGFGRLKRGFHAGGLSQSNSIVSTKSSSP
jgi:hypothetical protein